MERKLSRSTCGVAGKWRCVGSVTVPVVREVGRSGDGAVQWWYEVNGVDKGVACK